MATVYVDSAATGGADGTSWADAYTDFETAYTAADAGDTIELSGGTAGNTYAVTAYNMSKNMTIKGSSDVGHAGQVRIDSSSIANYGMRAQDAAVLQFRKMWFYDSAANQPSLLIWTAGNVTFEDCVVSSLTGKGIVLHQSYTGTFHAKRSRFLDCVVNAVTRQSTGSAYAEIYDACLFTGAPVGKFQNQILAGTSTATFNNCILGGTEASSLLSVASGATGAKVFNNCILLPIGLDVSSTQNIIDGNAGNTVTLNHCVAMENWLHEVANNYEADDGGGNIGLIEGETTRVKFKTARRPIASISLMIDDLGQARSPDGPAFAALCEARGMPASFCVQSRFVTSADAELLAGYINAGHSVSLHGASGASLIAANHPAIAITGPNPSTLTIASNTMTFTGTGQGGPITLDETSTIATVAGVINGWTGWSATTDPGTATNSSLTVGAVLADIGSTDTYNGGAGVTIDLDEDRFNTYELTTGKALLETAIREYIPGWVCKTQVYGQTHVDAASEQAAADAGFIAARGGAGEQGLWSWAGSTTGYRPFRSYAVQLTPAVFSDADAMRHASSLAEIVKFMGMSVNVYNHNLTGTSPSNPPLDATKWGLILDEFEASGVRVLNYDQQAAEMRDGATSLDGDLEYTRTFLESDAVWVPEVLPTSEVNAAGLGSSVPMTGIDGEPFSSYDRDIGVIQHTDADNHPFHPLNL